LSSAAGREINTDATCLLPWKLSNSRTAVTTTNGDVSHYMVACTSSVVKVKAKTDICLAPHSKKLTSGASGVDHTAFTLHTHHTCLYLVSVHQMTPAVVIAAI